MQRKYVRFYIEDEQHTLITHQDFICVIGQQQNNKVNFRAELQNHSKRESLKYKDDEEENSK